MIWIEFSIIIIHLFAPKLTHEIVEFITFEHPSRGNSRKLEI